MARYSRLASVEEKRNLKKALTFGGLTLLAIVILVIYGVPILGRFTAFVSDFGKSGTITTSTDTTPPAPPKFNTFPDFTNQNKIDLSGNSEAGASIKLTFNGQETENLANRDGHFLFTVTLVNGENSFYAMAVDPAGNEGQKTDTQTIVFDNKPPELSIENPENGAQFFGTKQRQTTIQGTTESNARITINDRVVSVDDNGRFYYTTTLSEGENKFVIKSEDRAGNNVEQELILSFSS
jgi:hypothetical protein